MTSARKPRSSLSLPIAGRRCRCCRCHEHLPHDRRLPLRAACACARLRSRCHALARHARTRSAPEAGALRRRDRLFPGPVGFMPMSRSGLHQHLGVSRLQGPVVYPRERAELSGLHAGSRHADIANPAPELPPDFNVTVDGLMPYSTGVPGLLRQTVLDYAGTGSEHRFVQWALAPGCVYPPWRASALTELGAWRFACDRLPHGPCQLLRRDRGWCHGRDGVAVRCTCAGLGGSARRLAGRATPCRLRAHRASLFGC
jgi:hypothetical protein